MDKSIYHEIKCNVHLEWTYWSFKNTMWNSSISTHAVNTDAIVQVIYLLLVWAAWVRSSAHKIAVLLHRNVAYRTRSSPAPNTPLQSSCKTHTRPVTTSLNKHLQWTDKGLDVIRYLFGFDENERMFQNKLQCTAVLGSEFIC